MKNFFLLQLIFILCVNTILSYSAVDKRDVHRIILRTSPRSKRHRSPNHQQKHRHRHHHHKNHESNEDTEGDDVSFERSSESSLERPAKFKDHYIQKPIKNHSSYFPNVEKYRNKRQKHHWKPPFSASYPSFDPVHEGSFTFPHHGYQNTHKEHFQKEKAPEFSTFNPLSGGMDEFSDFKFYQKFLNLKGLPSSNVATFLEPVKDFEPFPLNNTYKVYEDAASGHLEVKHDGLRSPSASRFINRNKVFDDTDNAQENQTKANSDKEKRNAAIRQRNKKMRD